MLGNNFWIGFEKSSEEKKKDYRLPLGIAGGPLGALAAMKFSDKPLAWLAGAGLGALGGKLLGDYLHKTAFNFSSLGKKHTYGMSPMKLKEVVFGDGTDVVKNIKTLRSKPITPVDLGKVAYEASFDRSGREVSSELEERDKWDNSNEKTDIQAVQRKLDNKDEFERRGGTGGTLQNNVAGAPAGGLV